MNEHEDSLEAELASWKPVPVSERLKQRIGQDIDQSGPFRRRVWLLAGTLAAACLLVMLLLRTKQDDNPRRLLTASSIPEQAMEFSDQLPSLRVYTRALNQSTEALDVLLDRHGAMGSRGMLPKAVQQAFPSSPSPFMN
ncbi:MAG TPA: hypothetical protein PLN21_04040 [Gemmatales bacterium]|nr:hypothetical protein [Gemmatales bacterium]